MPNPLNNVATADAYADACTLTCQPSSQLTVQVYNAAVYYRVTYKINGVDVFPTSEKFIVPGNYIFRQDLDFPAGSFVTKLEFRSGAAGIPARISANTNA